MYGPQTETRLEQQHHISLTKLLKEYLAHRHMNAVMSVAARLRGHRRCRFIAVTASSTTRMQQRQQPRISEAHLCRYCQDPPPILHSSFRDLHCHANFTEPATVLIS